MSLAPGMRLGIYEITAQIGKGGMGEVYRAHDTKLNRDVALKVLPESFASDPDRLARFTREAQVLASLNHPNIAHIHGLEESGGVRALVMELVEGEDLAQRIARGAIPIDEALPIARQIAEALEAAHERGIIHRDLKPANIKVRSDGAVKVLDFGLAKALDPSFANADLANSPTLTVPAMTEMGVILGTAAYMSPEQAAGKPADKRADLWAFGVVLFEMLTGRPAFQGESVSHVLASVLKTEPDWTTLPAGTPASIRRLLRRCLEKNRSRRLADIADGKFEIDEALTPAAGDVAAPQVTQHVRPARLGWILAGALTLAFIAAVGTVIVDRSMRAHVESRALRFTFAPPDGWRLPTEPLRISLTDRGVPGPMAVSPDGTRVVFVARHDQSVDRLWLRVLDELTPKELPATDGARMPFWSPNGDMVGFFSGGKLRKIPASVGAPVVVCDAPDATGGTWNQDDVILFGSENGALRKVSASGGAVGTASMLIQGEQGHWWPRFLPDGRHFLYRSVTSNRDTVGGPVFLASLDSSDRSVILTADSVNVDYANGLLFYLRGSALVSQAFNVQRLTVEGQARPVADQIQTQANPPLASRARGANPPLGAFSVSEHGVLAYSTAVAAPRSSLRWFGRDGQELASVGDPGDYWNLQISPDGKRAAIGVLDDVKRTRDIWLYDLARGLRSRFTFDGADTANSVWSPDGNHLAFNSRLKGSSDLYEQSVNAAGAQETLLAGDFIDKVPLSWSPDGRFLVYFTATDKVTTGNDVWVLPLFGDRKPFAFRQTPFNENISQISPDGRWIAYFSDESGTGEIYVSPFPGPGPVVRISPASGVYPRWRRDGKELFYLSPDGMVESVSVSRHDSAFEADPARPLFRTQAANVRFPYDVSADGQRFLVITDADQQASGLITVTVTLPVATTRQ